VPRAKSRGNPQIKGTHPLITLGGWGTAVKKTVGIGEKKRKSPFEIMVEGKKKRQKGKKAWGFWLSTKNRANSIRRSV